MEETLQRERREQAENEKSANNRMLLTEITRKLEESDLHEVLLSAILVAALRMREDQLPHAQIIDESTANEDRRSELEGVL